MKKKRGVEHRLACPLSGLTSRPWLSLATTVTSKRCSVSGNLTHCASVVRPPSPTFSSLGSMNLSTPGGSCEPPEVSFSDTAEFQEIENVTPDHNYLPKNATDQESTAQHALRLRRGEKRKRSISPDVADLVASTSQIVQHLDFGLKAHVTTAKSKDQVFCDFVLSILTDMDAQDKSQVKREITDILKEYM